MGVAIGSVIELVRPEPAALLCKATRDMIVIFWILVWLFRDRLYLRAQRAEQMHFLRRLIVRDHNNGAITSGASDHGKTDPSVTGCSLNDRCAWFQPTLLFRVGDDSVGGSIFHRAGRIHEFRLPQNLATSQFAQPSQPNQRRIADISINPGVSRTHLITTPSVIVLVVILVLRLNPFSKIVKPLLRRIQSMLYGHDDRSVPFQQTADLVEKLRAQKKRRVRRADPRFQKPWPRS